MQIALVKENNFLIFTVHIFAFSRVAYYFNSLIGHSGVCVRVTGMYSSS